MGGGQRPGRCPFAAIGASTRMGVNRGNATLRRSCQWFSDGAADETKGKQRFVEAS